MDSSKLRNQQGGLAKKFLESLKKINKKIQTNKKYISIKNIKKKKKDLNTSIYSVVPPLHIESALLRKKDNVIYKLYIYIYNYTIYCFFIIYD